MSNEEKMREEFEAQWRELAMLTVSKNPKDYVIGHAVAYQLWKACAAIKDAEIATRDAVIAQYEKREQLWVDSEKEIAARDLMIKELREATEKIAFMGMDKPMQADGEHFYQFQLRNCIAISAQALANSEHHNSRALEKMLLEARSDELRFTQAALSQMIARRIELQEAKLAELNKE